MKMKGQTNQDSNPVPPSQGSNHATDWANEASPSTSKQRMDLQTYSHLVLFLSYLLTISFIVWSIEVLCFTLTKHLASEACDTPLRYDWLSIQSSGPCIYSLVQMHVMISGPILQLR